LTRTLSLGIAATLFSCVLPAVFAAAPPAVGDKAPDFSLPTFDGKSKQFSQLAADRTTVLLVLRGYPGYQCPFCTRQFRDFLQNSAAFAHAGARVVFVYPGPPARLADRATEFLGSTRLPEHFDLLIDPDYTFTNRYGLRWDANGETAYPATFVLDPTGTIIFEKISRSHGGRTSATEILEVLPKTKMAR